MNRLFDLIDSYLSGIKPFTDKIRFIVDKFDVHINGNGKWKVVLLIVGGTALALILGAPWRAILSALTILFFAIYPFICIKRSHVITEKEKTPLFLLTLGLVVVILIIVISVSQSLSIFFGLLMGMLIHSGAALIFWYTQGVPLWAAAVVVIAVNILGIFIIYFPSGWLRDKAKDYLPKTIGPFTLFFKSLIKRLKQCLIIEAFLKEKYVQRMIEEIKDVRACLKDWSESVNRFMVRQAARFKFEEKLDKWIAKKELGTIFLLNCLIVFIPIPYLATAFIAAVRLREVKYGLWALIASTAVRMAIFTCGVYFVPGLLRLIF